MNEEIAQLVDQILKIEEFDIDEDEEKGHEWRIIFNDLDTNEILLVSKPRLSAKKSRRALRSVKVALDNCLRRIHKLVQTPFISIRAKELADAMFVGGVSKASKSFSINAVDINTSKVILADIEYESAEHRDECLPFVREAWAKSLKKMIKMFRNN